MRKLVFSLFFASLMGVFLTACEGPEGAVGPAGPAGAQGPKGDKGDKGDPGDVNQEAIPYVVTTGVIENVTDGINLLTLPGLTEQEAAEIDQSFVTLVYIKSQGAWWPMPGMVNFGEGKMSSYTFVHGVEGGEFFLDIVLTGYSEDSETIPARTFEDAKVVIIPALLMQDARVDLSNYEQVMETFKPVAKPATRTNSFRSAK